MEVVNERLYAQTMYIEVRAINTALIYPPEYMMHSRVEGPRF
jgi:hypothetical protein